MSDFSISIFSIAIVIIAGIVAGRIADDLSFPKTIPLILTGILIALLNNFGIFSFVIDLAAIQEMAIATAEIALVTVLFKEGMHLNLKNFQKHILTILLIAIFGTILTTVIVGFTVNLSLKLSLVTALLVGAIFTPTDPAATFAALRGGGSTRIEEKYESILGGESALNDVIAIIIVVVILIPSATHNTEIALNIGVISLALYEFFGGIIVGFLVGYFTLMLINYLPNKTEESMVSLAGAALIFGLGYLTNTSPAIGALVAGIVLANPKIFGREDYIKTEMNTFWENLAFLFEILAFIFIGAIFSLQRLDQELIVFAVILSVIVILGRFAGVYIITWILELFEKTKEDLSNRERFFIGFAGMRGLTTAILATLVYIAFNEASTKLAQVGQLILYSSILVLIFTGLFQGLFLKRVAKISNVVEEVDEVAELLARKIVIRTSLDYLMDNLQQKQISFDDFSRLSLHLKEELYVLEDNLFRIQAERKKNLTFISTALNTNEKAREALQLAYDVKEITNDLAYEKALTQLNDERKQLILLQDKMKVKEPIIKAKPHALKQIDDEIDRNLAEAAVDILKDPKITRILGIDIKSVQEKMKKSFRLPNGINNKKKSLANPQNAQKDIKNDAG